MIYSLDNSVIVDGFIFSSLKGRTTLYLPREMYILMHVSVEPFFLIITIPR